MNWEFLIVKGKDCFEDVEAFDSRERNYKLATSKAVKVTLDSVASGAAWSQSLKELFNRSHGGVQYNISQWTQHNWLLELDEEGEAAGRELFVSFLQEPDPAIRFQAFSEFASSYADQRGRAPGAILVVGSVLNFGIDPSFLPPLKSRALSRAEERVGFESPSGMPEEIYAGHLAFVGELENELRREGLQVRDRLDAQSVIWEWWWESGQHESQAGDSRRMAFSDEELILLLDHYLKTRDGRTSSLPEVRRFIRSLPSNINRRSDPSFRTMDGLRSSFQRFGAFVENSERKLDTPRHSYAKVWDTYSASPELLATRVVEIHKLAVSAENRQPNEEFDSRDETILLVDLLNRAGESPSEEQLTEVRDLIARARAVSDSRTDLAPPGKQDLLARLSRLGRVRSGAEVDPGLAELIAEFEDSEYAGSVASQIEASLAQLEVESADAGREPIAEAPEGKVLTRVHRVRERSRALVNQKKNSALDEHGCLRCEACGFDFETSYGNRGAGFIECHHTRPISDMKPGESTKIDDLALVCSNCHRMIHNRTPWLSVAEVRSLVESHAEG